MIHRIVHKEFSPNLAWYTFCMSLCAMFSGLNLAFWGISRMQLEVEAETNPKALKILTMREDSNFLLTTILWRNVGINVLLILLSSSVLADAMAFFSPSFYNLFR